LTKKDIFKNADFSFIRLYNYVQKFSFPRLAGTEGEVKAVNLTVDTFKEIGFKEKQIEKEHFEFSDFYSTTMVKFIMIINLTFSLMLMLLIYIHILFTLILIAVTAIILYLIVRRVKRPERSQFFAVYFGDTLEATNVFIKIPAKSLPEEQAGNIVISAHLDSKSQTLKTSWRVVLYRVWLYSGIFMGAIYILGLFFVLNLIPPIQLNLRFGNTEVPLNVFAFYIFISLITFSNLVLMFLNTHNKSPGALDNASGMAAIFELSAHFKDNPLENYNLWLCIFSAEELGTMGSREFVNNREDFFINKPVFQINIDMLSGRGLSAKKNVVEFFKSFGIFPRKTIAPILEKYMVQAASEEGINIQGFHLSVGAHTDTVPFHVRGWEAIDLTTRWSAKWAHNEADSTDKVDPGVVKEGCIITRKMALMLDEDYETYANKTRDKVLSEGKFLERFTMKLRSKKYGVKKNELHSG
jgi:hypothetical protein